jgi:hypothetical protein
VQDLEHAVLDPASPFVRDRHHTIRSRDGRHAFGSFGFASLIAR